MILRTRNGFEQAAVERALGETRVPGLSVAVADAGGIRFAGAAGLADLESGRPATAGDQFPWFSMTKIATATAAMALHADGRLDLDAPVGLYLPQGRWGSRHGHPTTRQLLTHTAGLKNPVPIRWVRPEGAPPDRALHDRILSRHGTPARTVGGRARYSNVGYLIAGAVIEAVTGGTVEACVTETVLEPLGMRDTGFAYEPSSPRSVGHVRMPAALVPALRLALPGGIVGGRAAGHTALRPFLVEGAAYGGLIGTAADAATLAAAHLADPEMRTITERGSRFDHGIGWFRKPADAGRTPAFVEHYGTGCGYWNAMRIYPELGLAMVAMANTTAAWDFDALFTRLSEG